MKEYNLSKKDIYKGNLILVNSKRKIKVATTSNSLEIFSSEYNDILIDKTANKFLQFILIEINSKDVIMPVSGYRTKDEQIDIYDTSIKESGIEFTKKYVALPDASEHQTGLAIDLGLKSDNIDFIRPAFPNSGICGEFKCIAPKYGFIERYKKDKESITNISAEEWHFRYVGYPHSKIIDDNNFCLEEYIEYLKQYEDKPLKYETYEISYIPYKANDIKIKLNDHDTISGNNIDGFIVTRKNS